MNNSIEPNLGELMSEKGVSKTVYSLVYPEVEQVYLDVYGNRERMAKLFKNAHAKRQDGMHEAFISGYVDWSKDIADIDRSAFKFAYPTSGSNESIRESIAHHGNTGTVNEAFGRPVIHIFEGEYEGYVANAKAHNVAVVKHDRKNYEKTLTGRANAQDRFYLSQPSGIDGNIWNGYEDFTRFLGAEQPDMKVMLDLAYLGTFANPDVVIDTTHKNIEAIFFSLSKSFGVYYQRIGGMFSKNAVPGLYGNCWFKNLPSMEVGVDLMKKFGVGELPTKYKHVQERVVGEMEKDFGVEIVPSDVILLATQPVLTEESDELKKSLTRVDRVRYCVTPRLSQIINPE